MAGESCSTWRYCDDNKYKNTKSIGRVVLSQALLFHGLILRVIRSLSSSELSLCLNIKFANKCHGQS